MSRCLQLGISVRDLALYDVGVITDILTERANDGEKYDFVATQEDFDRF